MNVLLTLLLLGASQDPDVVERIMTAFAQRMELARSAEEEQKAVRIALEKLRRMPDDHPRAAFHIAEMTLYAGRLKKAAEAFRDFHRDHPDDPNAATALISAAGLYEELAVFDTARHLYLRFARDHADDARAETAALQASMCLLYGGDAEACLKELRRRATDSWEARMQLARVAHMTGRMPECRRLLTEIRRDGPDRERARAAGRLLEEFGQIGKPAARLKIGEVSTADHLGKVHVLYLFSALSETAAAEVAALKRLQKRFSDKGVAITGVCVDAVPEAAERYRELHDPGWTVLHDPFGKRSAAALGTGSPPYVRVVDRKGTLRFLHLGGRDLEFVVESVLKKY